MCRPRRFPRSRWSSRSATERSSTRARARRGCSMPETRKRRARPRAAMYAPRMPRAGERDGDRPAGKILVSGIKFHGYHGLTRIEREIGVRYSVDVEMTFDFSAAARSDRVKDTIDYREVHHL